jgi:hypothetical protein
MRTKLVVASAILMVLVTAFAHGEEQPNNGYWWLGSTAEFKLGFVYGYVTAKNSDYLSDMITCAAEKSGGTLDKVTSEATNACLKDPLISYQDFSGIRFGQLADGVDEFYKDFRNKGIVVAGAMSYVRDELRGKSAEELQGELSKLRTASAPK